MKKAVWLSVLTILLFQSFGIAQRDLIEDEGPLPDSARHSLLEEVRIDSLDLSFFHLENIKAELPYLDSILTKNFGNYNPLYEKKEPWISLGTNGSASIPFNQFVSRKNGIDPGFHQFDAYKMELDSFRWYRSNVPFADLYFSPGNTENEFRVKSKYAQNFSNGLSLSLDYQRIIDNGYYSDQATKQSSIIVGFRHESKNKKSNTFFTYMTNIHQEQNNGGVVNPDNLDEETFQYRTIVPVYLNKSLSRLQNDQFTLDHFYYLIPPVDTSGTANPFQLDLVNSISYRTGFYRFYDDDIDATDSLFYGSLIVDDIGLRNYMSWNKFTVNPGLRFGFRSNIQLDAGLNYDLWNFDFDGYENDFYHDLSLNAKVNLSVFNSAALEGRGEYHLGNRTGDMLLEGKLSYYNNKYLYLFIKQSINRYNPSVLQNKLIVSGNKVYENDFDITTVSQSSAGLSLPFIGFSGSLAYRIINKHIYFDKEELFVQDDGFFNSISLTVGQKIKFRGFHFDNTVHLNYNDAEYFDIPLYYLDSKLYFLGPVFKNRFILHSGIEFFLTDPSYVPAYQPLTGSFYYQDSFETKIYPLLNVFANFKISSFRIFIRSENLFNLISPDVYFQAAHYPQNDFKAFRIGVSWQFID